MPKRGEQKYTHRSAHTHLRIEKEEKAKSNQIKWLNVRCYFCCIRLWCIHTLGVQLLCRIEVAAVASIATATTKNNWVVPCKNSSLLFWFFFVFASIEQTQWEYVCVQQQRSENQANENDYKAGGQTLSTTLRLRQSVWRCGLIRLYRYYELGANAVTLRIEITTNYFLSVVWKTYKIHENIKEKML